MFTSSGLIVRFLKVFEQSNYNSIKWVRYLTKASGSYQVRVSLQMSFFKPAIRHTHNSVVLRAWTVFVIYSRVDLTVNIRSYETFDLEQCEPNGCLASCSPPTGSVDRRGKVCQIS